jgi:hypothetical protein
MVSPHNITLHVSPDMAMISCLRLPFERRRQNTHQLSVWSGPYLPAPPTCNKEEALSNCQQLIS